MHGARKEAQEFSVMGGRASAFIGSTEAAGKMKKPRLKKRRMEWLTWTIVALVGALYLSGSLPAQDTGKTPAAAVSKPSKDARISGEQRTAAAMEKVRGNPPELRAFLARMPKGADLHSHLTGAIYAETWILEGIEDTLCVDAATYSFLRRRR